MFKENDIRPLKLKDKQDEFVRKDIAYLMKYQDKFLNIDCPTCNTRNEKNKFIKNGFNYIQCENCSMLYVSPGATFNVLKDFYANSVNYKFFNDYIFPASKEVRREKIFKPRVESVIEICKNKEIVTNNLLEIGAGYGIFLEEMTKKGLFNNVIGIEASDSLHERSESLGFNVYNGIFEELEINKKFNVIVCFEVIEHIFDPKSFLEKIYNLLDHNSMLLMTFPNYNGFDISLLLDISDSVDHEHLNYFNEKSISFLLKEIGFTGIEISTPGVMDVDLVRNKILSGEFEPSPFIKDICIDRYDEIGEKFQEFLIDNKLSSNMMITAIKKDN